ncbi:MAG: DeoR family transcriptional regulator [bacterium]
MDQRSRFYRGSSTRWSGFYLGFIGFLGFLGFEDPWYFLFFLFFLFFVPTPKPEGEGGSATKSNGSPVSTPSNLIEKQAQEKAEHLQKILELLESRDKIVNDDAEKLLGVSDRTVQRYFNELESEGKIKQVGNTGKGVFYTKI